MPKTPHDMIRHAVTTYPQGQIPVKLCIAFSALARERSEVWSNAPPPPAQLRNRATHSFILTFQAPEG